VADSRANVNLFTVYARRFAVGRENSNLKLYVSGFFEFLKAEMESFYQDSGAHGVNVIIDDRRSYQYGSTLHRSLGLIILQRIRRRRL
jgi:hypothetical protein